MIVNHFEASTPLKMPSRITVSEVAISQRNSGSNQKQKTTYIILLIDSVDTEAIDFLIPIESTLIALNFQETRQAYSNSLNDYNNYSTIT